MYSIRIKGLAPLPVRMNTLERVEIDEELKRVHEGKYCIEYKFTPVAPKTKGAEIGTIYEKDHTHPKKSKSRPKKRWLGKVGSYSNLFPSKEKSVSPERGLNEGVLLEYVANNLYRVLGDGYFETSKMRLARLPMMNQFLEEHEIALLFDEDEGVKSSLRVMSKWIPGYKNLSELRVKDGGKIISFMEYIEKYERPPEMVIDSEVKEEIELKGIMGVLAAASSIVDIDVLGTTGKNTGYIIEKDKEGKILRVRVVKIDPGLAFSYELFKQIKEIKEESRDKKDIIYSSHGFYIKWANLTDAQKDEFLEVKRHNLEVVKDPRILEYIFFRQGRFNRNNTEKMPKELASSLKEQLLKNLENQGKIYAKELEEYEPKRINIFWKEGRNSYERGDYGRAKCYHEKDLEINLLKYGENHKDSATCYNNLGLNEMERGDTIKALEYLEKGLSIWKKVLPYDHPDIAMSYSNLGGVQENKGEYDKALEYYEKSLSILKKVLPEDHPDIARCYNNLASVLENKGEYDKAVEYYEKGLSIWKKVLPEDHPDIARCYNNLGTVLNRKGEYDKGVEYYEKSLSIMKKVFPDDHPDIAGCFNNLGSVLRNKGEYDKSLEYYEKSLSIMIKVLPEDHPDIARCYNNLGSVHQNIGEHDKALEYYGKSLSIREKVLPEDHPDIARCYNNLGSVLRNKGEYNKALEYYEKSLSILKKVFPDDHPDIAESYNNIGCLHFNNKDYKKAVEFLLKSLEIMQNKLGENHPHTLATKKSIDIVKAKIFENIDNEVSNNSYCCSNCQRKEIKRNDFKVCSRCKGVQYCSRKCQRIDWKRHKTSCKPKTGVVRKE